ncbi:MAG: hypothetical protein ACRDJN_10665, partial [Chloroflexota bacterium]
MTRSIRVAIAALMLLGLLGLRLPLASAGITSIAHAQQVGQVEVNPGQAAPGQPITLVGSGWEPSDVLTVRLCETADRDSPCAALGAPILVDPA